MASDYPKHGLVLERDGLPNHCTWRRGNPENIECPHVREGRRNHDWKVIKDSVLDCVGNTPMIRINNLAKAEGVECELLCKAEFLNPGGSVKDRIGRRMLLDAEKTGRIKPGDILIEPTSGNTGVGLALAAAVKGYRMIATLPERFSQQKQDVLKGLGATIIRTPSIYPSDHLLSHMGVMVNLTRTLPNAHCLDQYQNPSNPMAHYDETAEEIWEQCDRKVDYVFIGAGTGGTLTGISRRLKELDPNIQIVAIDPVGSVLTPEDQLTEPHTKGPWVLEGTGKDFVPRVIDRSNTDLWIKTPDRESHLMARRLMREEGLMCGSTSGSAMWAALKLIKQKNIGKGKRCVVVFPDGIRNFMTKLLNDDWMYEQGYISEEDCAK